MSLSDASSQAKNPVVPVPPSFLPLVVLLLTACLVALGSLVALFTLAQGSTPVPFIILELCSGGGLASLIFVQQFKEELQRAWRRAAEGSRALLGHVPRALIPRLDMRRAAYSGVTSS